MNKPRTKKHAATYIKMLHGMPDRVEVLGFYKGIPIFHDPKYPAPDGVLYFINENSFYQNETEEKK